LGPGGLNSFWSNQKVCIILGALVFKNKFFWWWVVGGGGGWWWWVGGGSDIKVGCTIYWKNFPR